MQIAHKLSNISGGNRLVSVAHHNGKALVKVTDIPKEHHKAFNIPFKEFVSLLEGSHEKYLKDVATSRDVASSVLRGE